MLPVVEPLEFEEFDLRLGGFLVYWPEYLISEREFPYFLRLISPILKASFDTFREKTVDCEEEVPLELFKLFGLGRGFAVDFPYIDSTCIRLKPPIRESARATSTNQALLFPKSTFFLAKVDLRLQMDSAQSAHRGPFLGLALDFRRHLHSTQAAHSRVGVRRALFAQRVDVGSEVDVAESAHAQRRLRVRL